MSFQYFEFYRIDTLIEIINLIRLSIFAQNLKLAKGISREAKMALSEKSNFYLFPARNFRKICGRKDNPLK